MCGIVAYVGMKECAPILVEGLRRLEYRGYDSAGLAIHTGRGVEILRAVGKLENLDGPFPTPIIPRSRGPLLAGSRHGGKRPEADV